MSFKICCSWDIIASKSIQNYLWSLGLVKQYCICSLWKTLFDFNYIDAGGIIILQLLGLYDVCGVLRAKTEVGYINMQPGRGPIYALKYWFWCIRGKQRDFIFVEKRIKSLNFDLQSHIALLELTSTFVTPTFQLWAARDKHVYLCGQQVGDKPPPAGRGLHQKDQTRGFVSRRSSRPSLLVRKEHAGFWGSSSFVQQWRKPPNK